MVKVKSPVALVVKVKSNAKKTQYCLGTWNVRSMNPGKLDMIKQEMLRGFSGGTNGKKKNLPDNAGDIRDAGSLPGLERSPN